MISVDQSVWIVGNSCCFSLVAQHPWAVPPSAHPEPTLAHPSALQLGNPRVSRSLAGPSPCRHPSFQLTSRIRVSFGLVRVRVDNLLLRVLQVSIILDTLADSNEKDKPLYTIFDPESGCAVTPS